MSNKHKNQVPEATNGTPDVNPGAISPEFSALNSVVGYGLPDGETDTIGKLAGTALGLESDHLKDICILGRRIVALAKTDSKTVKTTCEAMKSYSAASKASLSVNTLQQYASIGELSETIGQRFFDLHTFRAAQKVKTVLLKVGKENGLAGQLDVIERYSKGEDLDEIKKAYGLFTDKGLKTSDQDALEVAESRGDNPAEFAADLAAKRIERMASSSWAKFIGKLIDKGELKDFLKVVRRVHIEKRTGKTEKELTE